MARNLSPAVRRELRNLDKDIDSRKSAMKALKLYVKELDSSRIPEFLQHVSETKVTCSSHGEHTISLFEVLARVHGAAIVSQIDNIMKTVIQTLGSSSGNFPLQQACSRVVAAIARYGIHPTTPEKNRREIIDSLSKPLADALLGPKECLYSGAALCLKVLVDSDNWRHASSETVNVLCLNVTGAMDNKPWQTNSHMGLVMSLAKHNSQIIEAYSRMLLHAGLRVLKGDDDVMEMNSQQRLSSIQMINFLMKCLDPRNIYSELEHIIPELEKCQNDHMGYVRGAAYEALQTANKIMKERAMKTDKKTALGIFDETSGIIIDSLNNASVLSPTRTSPELEILDLYSEYGSTAGSVSPSPSMQQSVARKVWRYDNGDVDVSLEDGMFESLISETSANGVLTPEEDVFGGFLSEKHPKKSIEGEGDDDEHIRIFTTPRRLIHSLQDHEMGSDLYLKKRTRHGALSSNEVCNHCDIPGVVNEDSGGPESISSTDINPVVPCSLILRTSCDDMCEFDLVKKAGGKAMCRVLVVASVVAAAFLAPLMWNGVTGCQPSMVPT